MIDMLSPRIYNCLILLLSLNNDFSGCRILDRKFFYPQHFFDYIMSSCFSIYCRDTCYLSKCHFLVGHPPFLSVLRFSSVFGSLPSHHSLFGYEVLIYLVQDSLYMQNFRIHGLFFFFNLENFWSSSQ